jgi:tRNA-binding protein
MIEYSNFEKVDIRVGKVMEVNDFPEARKPAYKLKIDFGGEIGIKSSSVQIVSNYNKEELVGKEVLCVVNFASKKIGSFVSEVLTLGVNDENGNCVLVVPSKNVPIGGKLY